MNVGAPMLLAPKTRVSVLLWVAAVSLSALTANAADEVEVLSKEPWNSGVEQGFTITYKHDGKIGRGARVHCRSGERPLFLVEGLDRGDGVHVDMILSDDNVNLATLIAPGYMEWALEVWRQTCLTDESSNPGKLEAPRVPAAKQSR